jgi:hypothetical protein
MQIAELKSLAEQMFKDQYPVRTLWQTIADHFYAERADFTHTRNVGQELADNLLDSRPLLVRRDLGNSFSAMLRDGDWFEMTVSNMGDYSGKLWLEGATRHMRKLMYHRSANFVRSTKEADHDYAAFGNAVISVERNARADGLLYRCWHLRDCAWSDDESGRVGTFCRKWSATNRQLVDIFGDKVHKNVSNNVFKEPFKKVDVRHLVMPANMFRSEEIMDRRFKWVSIFIDVTHDVIMQTTPMNYMMYVVPRFQTIAGSPYAYSPATVVGLPDARCLQAMTHTLLEASERYARPPILATMGVVRGDVDLSPDGITWVDEEYDERLGASLRTLAQDRGGFPIGLEMRAGVYETMNEAFYLNSLQLPETTREMTAYEVSERMKQFRRQNLPLFAPIEAEYNGALCETTFEVMMQTGMLGSPYDIPESLQGADVEFKFESPLTQSQEEEKVQRFGQTAQLLAQAAEFDQGVIANVNFDVALREAIVGGGAPASWLHNPEQVAAGREQARAKEMVDMAAQLGVDVNAA